MKKIMCALICCLAQNVFANEIPLELEFARTEEARSFGLMQRRALKKNQGMLFIYPKPQVANIWMFNCFIDLSVAFLDANHIIQEIHELKAYPEKMNLLLPIKNYHDLVLYSQNNSIAEFFLKKSLKSSFKVSFVLEMNAKWFYNAQVVVGDLVSWNETTGRAFVVKKMKYLDKN
jgi:uncharacterized membrane protein (UPF0127 family)